MNTDTLAEAMGLADSQAGFTYGWNDFPPLGLMFYDDGGIEAVRVPAAQASVRDVIIATGRAARADFKRIVGIGVMCSAWASKQSVADIVIAETEQAAQTQRRLADLLADPPGFLPGTAAAPSSHTPPVPPADPPGAGGEHPRFVAPQHAADRRRARLTYAVDVHGTAHTFTNVAGQRHHEYRPVRDCDTILSVLAQALAEATFTSHFFCPTGTHKRAMLL